MKKISIVVGFIYLLSPCISQNMLNLHQVLTLQSTKAINVSATGKVFYATNSATDKRVVVYDPSGNISMTVDTGRTYFCIKPANSNMYIGADVYAKKFDNNGNLIGGQISCTTLGFTPYNSGIRSITNDIATGKMYFGGLGMAVQTNSVHVVQTQISNPNMVNTGTCKNYVNAMAFKQDTLFMGLFSPACAGQGGNFYYTVSNNPLASGNISGLTVSTQNVTDIALKGNDIYYSLGYCLSGGCYARTLSYTGAIDFDSGNSDNILTLENCAGNIWAGADQGKLFKVVQNATWNFNVTSTMYNMNVPALNNVDSIFDISADASGELWIATNKGVYTTAVLIATGIKNAFIQNSYSIYPNPSNGLFTITTKSDMTINIYDVNSKLILSQKINEGQNNINLNTFTKGIYTVQIIGEKECDVRKIVLE